MTRTAFISGMGLAVILLLATLITAVASEGADWRFLAKSEGGVPIYYDRESISSTGKDCVSVWVKAVFEDSEISPAGLEGYVFSLALIELDCFEKMFIIRMTVVYDKEGNSLSAYSPRWGFLPPELPLEKLFQAACP